MSTDDVDEYFIYENRLASFHGPQRVTKRRVSTAATSRNPKTLSWPHKSIKPADMASAGFFFQPLPSNPDNVVCFLCNKSLDGWEEDDRPLEEHLKHSPECGWAITAAVDAELGDYAREDPRDALMSEARKATFAGRWPHENKKGWSCKTKQLVEAGWKYTPTLESDDNATCTYCHLGLDGWEKSDKPWDEHYSRAPDCPFFALISSKPAPKKTGRSKAARISKASRLSLQSVATAASDMTSLADVTADVDDSVLTTVSTMTAASKASKKTMKGKKAAATTTRARKTRAKKDDAVEVPQDDPDQDATSVPPSPPKPARGLKRSSEELEDAALTNAEAPAPKKLATKTRKARGSNATEASSIDADMPDAPEPTKKTTAQKTRKASGTRKVSGARAARELPTASVDSVAPVPVPNDDEIDRQLEADLERPLSDEEDILADPDTKGAAASRTNVESIQESRVDKLLMHTSTADFAMFDPAPAQPTDAQINADLKIMEDEMDINQKAETEEVVVPKKGPRAGTRKASKTAVEKTEESEPPEPTGQSQPRMGDEAEEPDELAEADVSLGSNSTVVRKSLGRASLGRASLGRTSLGSVTSITSTKSTAKRGRPPKKSRLPNTTKDEPTPDAATMSAAEPVDVDVKAAPAPAAVEGTKKPASTGKRGRPPKNPKPADVVPEVPAPDQAATEPKPQNVITKVHVESATMQESFSAAAGTPRVARKPVPAPKDSPFAIRNDEHSASAPASNVLAVPPKTPGHHATPAHSAKQATISPSPSPQASDAENRPPSSQPNTASSKGKRIPPVSLPAASTPTRQMSPTRQLSPSRQNVIGSLQSEEPWTEADLDAVFGAANNGQEDTSGAADRFFAQGGELTEQERNMTVEDWIYYNAGQAEQKLKFECESMVMAFEREGTRAMRALEGLVVAE